MLDELRVVGDHHVFNAIIRNTVKLGEAPLVGRPITTYATNRTRLEHTASSRGRLSNLARTDFRAAAARRLSEEREPPCHRQPAVERPPRSFSCGVRNIDVDRIQPNPEQPRVVFDEVTIQDSPRRSASTGVLQRSSFARWRMASSS